MAITVDYSGAAPWLITIPQSDLTLESGTKYKLTVDEFWILLRDFSDNENPMARPKLYRRIPATASTPSITEIEETYYALEFEDGLYSVNIIDGNTNIRDVEVKNQVSVNTNNTTGFIDPTFLEYSTFGGGVWYDALSGVSGTVYPIGTPARPSNNFTDTLAIGSLRGFGSAFVVGDATINGGLDFTDFTFIGQGQNLSSFTIDTVATVVNCTFRYATVTGVLDGDSHIEECIIDALDFVSGVIENCILNPSTVTLGGSALAQFIDCESGVPGTATPVINCGGAGQSLTMRGYNGGVKLINKTGADAISIDLVSGQVRIDLTTVTNGPIVVRGTGKVVDDATGDWLPSGTYGSMVLTNETVHGQMLQDLWKLMGLDASNPMTVTPTSRIAGDISQVISGDGVTTSTVTRQ